MSDFLLGYFMGRRAERYKHASKKERAQMDKESSSGILTLAVVFVLVIILVVIVSLLQQ